MLYSFTWYGEFRSVEFEQRFQSERQTVNANRMGFICFATSLAMLFGLHGDYLTMSSGGDFSLMIAMRGSVFVTGMCVAMLAHKKRLLPMLPYLVALYMIIIGLSESVEAVLDFHPDINVSIPFTLIVVLMFYLFVPIRLFPAFFASAAVSIMYIFSLSVWSNASAEHLSTLSIFFLLVNAYGVYYLIGFGRIQRREYLALNEEKRLNARLQEEINERRRTEELLRELAIRDELTGVYNRRHFMDLFERELSRSSRYDIPLSVMMFDVDNFKAINDRYGHAAGDAVLVRLSEICGDALRTIDSFARLGGEEFAALLPRTNLDCSIKVAERIRKEVAETLIETEQGVITISVSVGVAARNGDSVSVELLLSEADKALYKAKDMGRNRVVSWGETGECLRTE